MDSGLTSAQIRAAGQSHPGQRRTLNEDAWWIAQEPDTGAWWAQRGRLFVVADGMGGHAAGEVASQLAVETLVQVYYGREDTPLSPRMRLEQAIQAANRRVYEQAASQDSQAGMGTTIVAAVVHDGWLTIANVGDSRAYRVRDVQAQQITRDHSWVAEQVTVGALTQEEARNHIYKNVVTRCLGHRPTVQIDLFEQPLAAGDIVLLCSDGLSNLVSEEELARILADSATTLSAAVSALLNLANERGAPDNVTAVAFQVLALPTGLEQGQPTVPARAGAGSGQVTMVVPTRASPAADAAGRRPARSRKASKLRVVLLAALAVWGIVLCAAGVPLLASRSGLIRDWLGWPAVTSTSGPPGTVTPSQPWTATLTVAPLASATIPYTPTSAVTMAAPATATSTLSPTVTLTSSPTATLTLTTSPPAETTPTGMATATPTVGTPEATVPATVTLTVTQP